MNDRTPDRTLSADRRGADESAATPPLPKVELPPINRAPVDRSTAGYLANTPGFTPTPTEPEMAAVDAGDARADAARVGAAPADSPAGPLPSPFGAPAGGTSDAGSAGASEIPDAPRAPDAEVAAPETAASAGAGATAPRRRVAPVLWTGLGIVAAAAAGTVWYALSIGFG